MSIENINQSTDNVQHSGKLPDGQRELPVTEFSKPLSEAEKEGLLRTPDNAAELTEKKKKKRGPIIALAAGGTALLAAGGLWLGLSNNGNAQAPEKDPVVPAEPVEPVPEEPVGEVPVEPETPEVPVETSNLPSSEELYDMLGNNPEGITQAATITAESVTVDGKIDWGLYSQKLVNILEMNINAGSTETEFEQIFNAGGVPEEMTAAQAAEYDALIHPAIGLQIGADGVDLRGVSGAHEAQMTTAYVGWLKSTEPVHTDLEYVSHEVANELPTSAYVTITHTISDNFFSSGALDPENPNDVGMLQGRNADHNKDVIVTNYNVSVAEDGSMKIMSVSNG